MVFRRILSTMENSLNEEEKILWDFKREEKENKNMLASGKTPGMLTYSLRINPPTEWMQLSQAAAICNSGPSELKNSVLQAKIGKTLFAKSTAGSGQFIKYEPSIQSLWSSLHSPCVRLFSKGERCRLLTVNGPSATIVNTPDLLYFFPVFYCGKNLQKAVTKDLSLSKEHNKEDHLPFILQQPLICHWERRNKSPPEQGCLASVLINHVL